MTIPEACQLVIEASSMGKGGEIYVFDMGKSIKIIDLAEKMIQLAGLEKNKELAFKWLETAAKQGHPRAQNNVGVMYYKGEGVKKDLLLAQMWYMISSSKGMSEAKKI